MKNASLVHFHENRYNFRTFKNLPVATLQSHWDSSTDIPYFDGIKLQWRALLLQTQTNWEPITDIHEAGTTCKSGYHEHRVRYTALIGLQWHHQWLCRTKIEKSVWTVMVIITPSILWFELYLLLTEFFCVNKFGKNNLCSFHFVFMHYIL